MIPKDVFKESQRMREYLPHGAELHFHELDGQWHLIGQKRWYQANNLQDVFALALEGGLNV